MRYFVYRDSQILGPFAPEELHQAGDLRRDTLICEESVTGKRDADWRPLKDVPELSEVRVLEPAFFDEAPPGMGPGGLERLELDSLGVPEDDEQGVAWIRTLFEDADFRNRFAGLLPRTEDDPQQLSLAKSRIAQLTGELEALRSRLNEVENARHAHWKTVELPKILESAVTLPTPLPVPELAPPLPSTPTPEPPPAPAVVATPPAPRLRIAAPTPLPAAAETTAAPAQPEPLIRGLRLKISTGATLSVAPPAIAPLAAPAPSQAEAQSSSLTEAAAGPVFDWQEPPPSPPAKAETPTLPEAKPLPSGPIAPEPLAGPEEALSHEESLVPPGVRPIELQPPAEPEPQAVAAPVLQPVGLEPAPISLEASPPIPAPGPSWQPPAETSTLQAVPLPPLPATAPPLTAVFGSGELAAPASSSPGSAPVDFGAGAADLGSASPTPAASDVADVVARLAKPAPTQIPAPKPPRRGASKAVLVALFVLTAAVAGAFFLFLRNPRDLKTMVAMGSDQKPLGVEGADESTLKPATAGAPAAPQAASPFPSAPPQAQDAQASNPAAEAPATAPAPAPVSVAPAAAPVAPAPSSPAAGPANSPHEGGDAAVALVKEFPLDGGRGTVGQWLQYSYAANPGDGNKEEWTSGAVDATIYLIQYQVHPGSKAGPAPSINYLFEADVQRKTVRGKSDNARQLLAGGEPQAAKKPKAAALKKKRPARRPKRKAAAPAEPNKPLSLLPLPTDAELVPPAEDDSSFQDATVLRQPGQ